MVEKKYAILTREKTAFIWDYKEQETVRLDPDKIPAISVLNDPNIIDNAESVMFPANPDDLKITSEKEEDDVQEKISLRSRNEQSRQINEQRTSSDDDDDDDEQSILIQKLREHVIRFERLLGKFLDPDLPTSRKLKKKYLEERSLFKDEGYIEFIDAIKLKVEAICTYENNYEIEQFDGINKDDEIRDGYFLKKIEDARKGDFHSAQEVVNSVMQIVIEEEYGVPRRRLVTKIR